MDACPKMHLPCGSMSERCLVCLPCWGWDILARIQQPVYLGIEILGVQQA